MLGLFSVAALPRRLSLDFSDITEKGLSFDTIRGDFELREGNAYTSNLLLRGPAAEIGVAGRTGLASQDYDQTAIVTGNLGRIDSSRGSAGGWAGYRCCVAIVFAGIQGATQGYCARLLPD